MKGSNILLNKSKSGFTLIELILAISVLGITLAVVSRSLLSLSEQSVVPTVFLQASWIADSYLKEITYRHEQQGLAWCDHLNSRKTIVPTSRRMTFRSLCEYQTAQPMAFTNINGQTPPTLRDYQVMIELEKPSQVEWQALGVEKPTSHAQRRVLKVRVTVLHPVIDQLAFERWIWAS